MLELHAMRTYRRGGIRIRAKQRAKVRVQGLELGLGRIRIRITMRVSLESGLGLGLGSGSYLPVAKPKTALNMSTKFVILFGSYLVFSGS